MPRESNVLLRLKQHIHFQMKPEYRQKLESARKKLAAASQSFGIEKNHRNFFKPIWRAFSKLIRTWLVKNGLDWKKGTGRYEVEHLFRVAAPPELRKKFSLIELKLRCLSYDESYSPRLYENAKLTEWEWKMETEICLQELTALADCIETGSPPTDFRGEVFHAYRPGQWVKYYCLSRAWKGEKFWHGRLGKALSVDDRQVAVLWENRTIWSIRTDNNLLEPVDRPAENMSSPLQIRRTWFSLHSEHRQNPLYIPSMRSFNHSIFYVCPCCGYPVLKTHPIMRHLDYDLEPEACEICLLCDWADEIHSEFADADQGEHRVNFDYSLNEARHNFEKFSCIFRPGHEPFFSINTLPHIIELKQKLRLTFDQMVGETNLWIAYLLWHDTQKIKNDLADALKSEESEYPEHYKMTYDDEGFPMGRDFSWKWKWAKPYYSLGQWHKNYVYGRAKIIWFGCNTNGYSLITRHIPLHGFATSHVSYVLDKIIGPPRDDETTSCALRRNWFDLHPEHSLKKQTCPSCGFPTHEKPSAQEACFLCGWTYDQQDDFDAAEISNQANGSYSLFQARENFENHYCMFSPDDSTLSAQHHLKPEILRKKEVIRNLFYNILECNQPELIKKYWIEICKIQREIVL